MMNYFRQGGAEHHDVWYGLLGEDIVQLPCQQDRPAHSNNELLFTQVLLTEVSQNRRRVKLIALLHCDFICLQKSPLVCAALFFSRLHRVGRVQTESNYARVFASIRVSNNDVDTNHIFIHFQLVSSVYPHVTGGSCPGCNWPYAQSIPPTNRPDVLRSRRPPWVWLLFVPLLTHYTPCST